MKKMVNVNSTLLFAAEESVTFWLLAGVTLMCCVTVLHRVTIWIHSSSWTSLQQTCRPSCLCD